MGLVLCSGKGFVMVRSPRLLTAALAVTLVLIVPVAGYGGHSYP
mgnify:CR=1 FL=1